MDTVVDGHSGILFYEQAVKDLVNAVKVFETTGVRWSAEEIKANSEKFSVKHFKEQYSSFVKQCIDKYQGENGQTCINVYEEKIM